MNDGRCAKCAIARGSSIPALCILAAPLFGGVAQAASCTAALGQPEATAGPLKLEPKAPVTAELAVTAGHSWLVEIGEQGNDAAVEILDPKGQVLVRTDNPEKRTATQRAVFVPQDPHIAVHLDGQEESSGLATVRAFDLTLLQALPECVAVYRSLAAGDAEFCRRQGNLGRAGNIEDKECADALPAGSG